MQTKILFSLCVLFMSVVVSAQQTSDAVINNAKPFDKGPSFAVAIIPDKSAAAFNLHVDNPSRQRIDLQIRHKVNGVVIDSVITDVQFSCRYNFDQADDGQYLITLVSGKEKITKTADINTVTRRNVLVE